MDRIFIEQLKVETIIGTYDWERKKRQAVVFDIEMGFDTAAAAGSDEIDQTVNYHAVADRIKALVAEQEVRLLEAIVDRITKTILTEFPIEWIEISAAKPGVVPGAKNVGVRVRRTR